MSPLGFVAWSAPGSTGRAARPRPHRRITLMLTLILVVLAVGSGPATAQPRAATTESVVRLDNDATGPLFPSWTLLPGSRSSACVEISYRDTERGAAIGLFVEGARGDLNDYLLIHIEVGRGGRYGDCSSFVGQDLYTGTIADLASAHGSADRALRSAGLSGSTGAISYRLTLELADDNRAQGRTSQAAFTWETTFAESTPPDSDGPTAKPGPRDPSAPITSGSSPTPGNSSTPDDSPTLRGSSTPATPSAQIDTPGSASSSKRNSPPGAGGGSTTIDLQGGPDGSTRPSAVDDIVTLVKQAAFAVAKGSVISLFGLVLVMIFLAVHSRLDRRDPKLAEAPLTPTFLGFDGPHRTKEAS